MKKIAALILSLIVAVSCISVFAESDSGKGYLSTFDVASAGDVTLDVMITSYYRVVVYQALFQELCYTAGDAVDW